MRPGPLLLATLILSISSVCGRTPRLESDSVFFPHIVADRHIPATQLKILSDFESSVSELHSARFYRDSIGQDIVDTVVAMRDNVVHTITFPSVLGLLMMAMDSKLPGALLYGSSWLGSSMHTRPYGTSQQQASLLQSFKSIEKRRLLSNMDAVLVYPTLRLAFPKTIGSLKRRMVHDWLHPTGSALQMTDLFPNVKRTINIGGCYHTVLCVADILESVQNFNESESGISDEINMTGEERQIYVQTFEHKINWLLSASLVLSSLFIRSGYLAVCHEHRDINKWVVSSRMDMTDCVVLSSLYSSIKSGPKRIETV